MEHNALIILKHRDILIYIKIQRKMIPVYSICKTISILKLSAANQNAICKFLFQLVVLYFRFPSEAIGADIEDYPFTETETTKEGHASEDANQRGTDVVICDR